MVRCMNLMMIIQRNHLELAPENLDSSDIDNIKDKGKGVEKASDNENVEQVEKVQKDSNDK